MKFIQEIADRKLTVKSNQIVETGATTVKSDEWISEYNIAQPVHDDIFGSRSDMEGLWTSGLDQVEVSDWLPLSLSCNLYFIHRLSAQIV